MDRSSHRGPWRQRASDTSTSNDSIMDITSETSDDPPSHRYSQPRNSTRYQAPQAADLPHTPDQQDDSGSSTGPPRSGLAHVERALRLPDFERLVQQAGMGSSSLVTPPVPTVSTNAAPDDDWLMGRHARRGPTWGSAESSFDPLQGGFRPFPLPPPPRHDIHGRSLAARGSISAQSTSMSTEESGMDFSMASFTSPTHHTHPYATSSTLGAPPPRRIQEPPTIESIEREIAYWRRNPSTVSGNPMAMVTPQTRTAPEGTGLAIPRSATFRDGPPLGSSPRSGTSPAVDRAVPARYQVDRSRHDDVSIRERFLEDSVADSMDLALPPGEAHSPNPVSTNAGPSNQASMSVPRERQPDTSVSDTDTFTSPRTRAYIQNISDSLISSDATMERYQDVTGGEGTSGHPRISEEPELESERSEDQQSVGHEDDEQQEDGGDDEEDEDSTASSTRHLRDDELELLILQNLGFHGDFYAPGKIIRAEDFTESEAESGSDTDGEDRNGLDDSIDELAICSRVPGARENPGAQRKRKRASGARKRSVFNVDKRRKQWLSEMEDRALRRGPIMGISQEEFKQDMLDDKDWKQLLHHEISDTSWKYIPIVGAGFLPYADLAHISHPGPRLRARPRSIPTGPAHGSNHRSRHITMAMLAAAHEAVAHGQAGEEYGISVLPPDDEHYRRNVGFGDEPWEEEEHTLSDSDTEVAEQRPSSGPPHAHLEGSFGRLNVEDQRLAMEELGDFA